MNMQASFILASASPRRRELLGALIPDFEIIPSDIDEEPLDRESPEDHVLRLSKEKALAVSCAHPADGFGCGYRSNNRRNNAGQAINARRGRGDAWYAERQDTQGNNRLCDYKGDKGVIVNDVVESSVIFKDISRDEMDWYIRTSEPYDKAGGYAVQGKASFFIKEIRGSYTNVIGLPLCEVVTALKKVGALKLA